MRTLRASGDPAGRWSSSGRPARDAGHRHDHGLGEALERRLDAAHGLDVGRPVTKRPIATYRDVRSEIEFGRRLTVDIFNNHELSLERCALLGTVLVENFAHGPGIATVEFRDGSAIGRLDDACWASSIGGCVFRWVSTCGMRTNCTDARMFGRCAMPGGAPRNGIK